MDLIALIDLRPIKVEVKTGTCRVGDRWAVQIATRGGNQSWTGVAKRFDPARCDYLFAHVGDGRRWFIPTSALQATTQVTLGGPRYSEFEIDRGRPLSTRTARRSVEWPAEPGGAPELESRAGL